MIGGQQNTKMAAEKYVLKVVDGISDIETLKGIDPESCHDFYFYQIGGIKRLLFQCSGVPTNVYLDNKIFQGTIVQMCSWKETGGITTDVAWVDLRKMVTMEHEMTELMEQELETEVDLTGEGSGKTYTKCTVGPFVLCGEHAGLIENLFSNIVFTAVCCHYKYGGVLSDSGSDSSDEDSAMILGEDSDADLGADSDADSDADSGGGLDVGLSEGVLRL